MDRDTLRHRIFGVAHLTGQFTLRSGATSTEYFDKYRFESDPVLLEGIAEALAPLVPDDTEVLAGLELGGVPLAVALSRATGLPAAFVRKEAKAYGTAKLAEGADVDGRHVTVVEDVVTSGGQVVMSCRDLVERGAKLAAVLCVIDREAGGPEAIAELGLELRPLFKMSELTASS